MKGGLFKKYFLIFICLILLNSIIFSSLFLFLLTKYFKEDKYKLLYNNAVNVKNIVINNYYNNMNMYLDLQYIGAACNIISSSTDADIFLADVNGEIIIGQNIKLYNRQNVIPSDVVSEVLNQGIYKSYGNLKGVYKDTHYILAIPVEIDGSDFCSIVFVVVPTKNVEKLLLDMIKIFIISFIIVIVISMGIIWIVTDKIISPLKEIATMTKIFSKGDFRKKITVYSNDEIGELSNSLNEMALSLEKIEESRRYFIASVSHELKTPITIISGSIEGMIDGVISPEKYNEYLLIVYNEIKRLSKVVVSMTNLSKIDSGQMKLSKQEINISEIIRQVIFNFESEILKKDITIYGLDNCNIFVLGDKDMIYQVIYNLVENAIKFTSNGGYIKIRFKITHEYIYIGIKNSGEGICDQDVKYIFDKFYKVDKSRSKDKNGVGLGLYIVRQILRLHGSDIEVESKLGEYVEFFFWLQKVNNGK